MEVKEGEQRVCHLSLLLHSYRNLEIGLAMTVIYKACKTVVLIFLSSIDAIGRGGDWIHEEEHI